MPASAASTVASRATSRKEEAAFNALRPRLSELGDVARPSLDPRAVAMSALLAADCLRQPDTALKVEALTATGMLAPGCVDELADAARAMLYVLGQRRGVAPTQTAERSRTRGEAKLLRMGMLNLVERALLESDDARLWLETMRDSQTDLDVVYDLRCLANLYHDHADVLARAEGYKAEDVARARDTSDALETELRGGVASEWDDWLARTWTLIVPLYEEACHVARFVLGKKVAFPSLMALARVKRWERYPENGSGTWRRVRPSLPPPIILPAPTITESAPPAPVVSAPPAPSEVDPADVESLASDVPPPLPSPPSPPSPTVPPAGVAPAEEPPRVERGDRFDVALEVGIHGDSNFYVGFTENFSSGGIFVATYMTRPIGSKMEVTVELPGDDAPLVLDGEVRWIREYSPESDVWPGMGIRFEAIPQEAQARITAFLATRDPLFFDED